MEAFQEQVEKYKNEEKPDFRRMNLAYSFQDLVASIDKTCTKEAIESIKCILQLQDEDKELIKTIGYDLLETSVKLHILFGTSPDKILFEFSKIIAFESSPKELLIQINTLMVMMKENPDESGFDMFKNIGNEGKNVFKTVSAFYLSIILRRIDDKFLKTAFQELYLFVDLIKEDIETSQVLGLGIFLDLLEGIRERSFMIKINASKEVLKFLFDLIIVFESFEKYESNYEETIKLLFEMYGDLDHITEIYWKLNNTPSDVFVLLSKRLFNPKSIFKLPSILSSSKIFQLTLSNSIKSAESYPNQFIQVFNKSVENLDSNIKPQQLLTLHSPYSWPSQLFLDLIHACGLLPTNQEKLNSWKTFLSLIEKIEKNEKFRLLINLIKKVAWDQARSFLIDWAGEEFTKGRMIRAEVERVLSCGASIENLHENPETFHACVVLFKRIKNKGEIENDKLLEGIRNKFKEAKTRLTDEHTIVLLNLDDLGI